MKKPDHKLQVKENCLYCAGRGEMKDQYIRRTWGSDYWTYKKCIHCDGTGKNNKYCVKSHCPKWEEWSSKDGSQRSVPALDVVQCLGRCFMFTIACVITIAIIVVTLWYIGRELADEFLC